MERDMATSVGLVVDDDTELRLLIAQALRRGGLRVLEAGSGREALRLAQTSAPDFVVTDIGMPGLDGVELCRRLRQLPATSKVPIVVVTGSGDAGRRGDRRWLRCRPREALFWGLVAGNDSTAARG